MAALARREQRSTNIWPGFVDALATLLMVIIFLLMIFVLAQFFLGEALSGRDQALKKLEFRVGELADQDIEFVDQAGNVSRFPGAGKRAASAGVGGRDLPVCRQAHNAVVVALAVEDADGDGSVEFAGVGPGGRNDVADRRPALQVLSQGCVGEKRRGRPPSDDHRDR